MSLDGADLSMRFAPPARHHHPMAEGSGSREHSAGPSSHHMPHTAAQQAGPRSNGGREAAGWGQGATRARESRGGEFVHSGVDPALWNELVEQQTAKLYVMLDDLLEYLPNHQDAMANQHIVVLISEQPSAIMHRFSDPARIVDAMPGAEDGRGPVDHFAALHGCLDHVLHALAAMPRHAAAAEAFRARLQQITASGNEALQRVQSVPLAAGDVDAANAAQPCRSRFSSRHAVARTLRRVLPHLIRLEHCGVATYSLTLCHNAAEDPPFEVASAAFPALARTAAAPAAATTPSGGQREASTGLDGAATGSLRGADEASMEHSTDASFGARPLVPGHLLPRELMAVFDEAAEARRGAAAAAEGAPGEPSKKRNRKEEAHMYRDTIGIGNVGKKGGADTRGGLTVKTVELCNYIYHAGGWEGLKHSREKKLDLLRHFGWQEEKGPDNLTTSERQDKAIQSLTTQVREYFVKTGVFGLLDEAAAAAAAAAASERSGGVGAAMRRSPFARKSLSCVSKRMSGHSRASTPRGALSPPPRGQAVFQRPRPLTAPSSTRSDSALPAAAAAAAGGGGHPFGLSVTRRASLTSGRPPMAGAKPVSPVPSPTSSSYPTQHLGVGGGAFCDRGPATAPLPEGPSPPASRDGSSQGPLSGAPMSHARTLSAPHLTLAGAAAAPSVYATAAPPQGSLFAAPCDLRPFAAAAHDAAALSHRGALSDSSALHGAYAGVVTPPLPAAGGALQGGWPTASPAMTSFQLATSPMQFYPPSPASMPVMQRAAGHYVPPAVPPQESRATSPLPPDANPLASLLGGGSSLEHLQHSLHASGARGGGGGPYGA